MQVIEKPWGVTRCILKSRRCEIWNASIRSGGKSSVHRHNCVNHFYVVRGDMLVHDLDALHPAVRLNESFAECYTVPAGHWHQFEALSDVELIETYYAEDWGEVTVDIERQVAVEAVHG